MAAIIVSCSVNIPLGSKTRGGWSQIGNRSRLSDVELDITQRDRLARRRSNQHQAVILQDR